MASMGQPLHTQPLGGVVAIAGGHRSSGYPSALGRDEARRLLDATRKAPLWRGKKVPDRGML